MNTNYIKNKNFYNNIEKIIHQQTLNITNKKNTCPCGSNKINSDSEKIINTINKKKFSIQKNKISMFDYIKNLFSLNKSNKSDKVNKTNKKKKINLNNLNFSLDSQSNKISSNKSNKKTTKSKLKLNKKFYKFVLMITIIFIILYISMFMWMGRYNYNLINGVKLYFIKSSLYEKISPYIKNTSKIHQK